MHKKVKHLQPGDRTEWYKIISLRQENGKVIAEVQFNDGGISPRIWDNPEALIPLQED